MTRESPLTDKPAMTEQTANLIPPRLIRRMAMIISPVAIVGLFGAASLGWLGDLNDLPAIPGRFADTPWALPVAILVFCIGAFLALPQFALIAAAVIAFGPVTGFAWSWLSILFSGTATFFAGRWIGEGAFRRYAGDRARRLSGMIERNAFIASAIVRNVPAGPFLFVNMAFGISGARWLPYISGLALGTIPKTALIAFAGQGVVSAATGSPWIGLSIALAVVLIWFGLGFAARRLLVTDRQNSPD
ncbi:MAG: VTT domain-containing protein [Pseudomonadota bacterium]